MDTHSIEQQFRSKVCEEITLIPQGHDRYVVDSPFVFDDGDHLAIILKRLGKEWFLSDEGHTFMHLTYDLDEADLRSGTRQKIIENALAAFSVEDRDGELVALVQNDLFGDALFSFVQALLKVSDVSFLTRERVVSTFLEDFRVFMTKQVPTERLVFDWHHPKRDPQRIYLADCRVNRAKRPLFVYGIQNDSKARDVTISLLQFERWGLEFRSLGIFEDQEEIQRRVLARLSDVIGKQFSSLGGNEDRIASHLEEILEA